MAQIEARWEDDAGISPICRGKLEDVSAGGLGLRITEPIRVGAKLVVLWRQENISGTVVHCRQIGQNHMLGIERDAVQKPDDA
jgi:PilZ domain